MIGRIYLPIGRVKGGGVLLNGDYRMRYFICSSILAIGIVFFCFSGIRAEDPNVSYHEELSLEIQEKLSSITNEEKDVLEKLFKLTQDIEEMDKSQLGIAVEVKKRERELEDIENLIAEQTLVYEKNLNAMEQVLKAYQRSSASSYIDLILSSDNLKTLLQRINILENIAKNTNELLESLQDSKIKLDSEKLKARDKLLLVEEQQQRLEETLEQKRILKEELEAYLVSLEEEQVKYEEYLSNIEKLWGEIKPMFSEITKSCSKLMQKENLPIDAIETEISFFSVKGTIEEETFNNIMLKQSFPTKLEFKFLSNKLEVLMPEKNLCLSGTFDILDKKKIVFQVDEGSFWGISLEESAIEDLFSEGYLEFNLEPLLGENILKSVEIFEDKIEIQIIPVFF